MVVGSKVFKEMVMDVSDYDTVTTALLVVLKTVVSSSPTLFQCFVICKL